jgi:hypothetical protein
MRETRLLQGESTDSRRRFITTTSPPQSWRGLLTRHSHRQPLNKAKPTDKCARVKMNQKRLVINNRLVSVPAQRIPDTKHCRPNLFEGRIIILFECLGKASENDDRCNLQYIYRVKRSKQCLNRAGLAPSSNAPVHRFILEIR